MVELVESGKEWNAEEAGLWWRWISGEVQGQRASRPWLAAREDNWEEEEWGEELWRGWGGLL